MLEAEYERVLTISRQTHEYDGNFCQRENRDCDWRRVWYALIISDRQCTVRLTCYVGIGFEFAKLLLERGANVLIADLCLRPESTALISDYEHGEGKSRAIFHKTDVTSWLDLDSMFATAIEHFQVVDIVCPCAGIFEPPFSSFWEPPGTKLSKDNPAGDRYKIIDVNLTHPIRVTQQALAHFLASSPRPSQTNPKSIVHLCSVASQGAGLLYPMYIATKHGLDGFVRSLGDLEASHGIRVTAVEPGAVRTPLFTDNPEKFRIIDEEKDGWIHPHEVARVMLALVERNEISLGEDGSFINDSDAKSSTEASTKKIPIRGGVVVEVLENHLREVPLFNNPGPTASGARGAVPSGAGAAYKDIVSSLSPGWGARHKGEHS